MVEDRVSLAGAAEWVHWSTLKRWVKNPRKNAEAVPKVAAAIKRFGFVAPAVVWLEQDRLVAGDTRVQAMAALMQADPDFVPKGAPGPGMMRVVHHSFASEADADAYALADNRLGELADWDPAGVNEILARLDQRDRVIVGFEAPLVVPKEKPVLNLDEVPPAPADPTTKPGDIWELGDHRLVCGDSTQPDTFAALMAGTKASMMWTDPPYGVSYVSKTKAALTIANDDLTSEELRGFLIRCFTAANVALTDGAALYIAHPAGVHSIEFLLAFRDVGWRLHQTLVWKKDRFALGHSDYHYIHEPILFGYRPGGGRRGRGGEGWYGDNAQASVFEVPKPQSNADHPTMKPPELIERMILNSSAPEAIVLDPFGGSGSTMVACERTGRSARLAELSPVYCDVIVRRWEHLTGKKATMVVG